MLHIKVHIEVSERGYAYTDEPSGQQDIDLEINERLAPVIDVSLMIDRAVEMAVSDYLRVIETKTAEPEPA